MGHEQARLWAVGELRAGASWHLHFHSHTHGLPSASLGRADGARLGGVKYVRAWRNQGQGLRIPGSPRRAGIDVE